MEFKSDCWIESLSVRVLPTGWPYINRADGDCWKSKTTKVAKIAIVFGIIHCVIFGRDSLSSSSINKMMLMGWSILLFFLAFPVVNWRESTTPTIPEPKAIFPLCRKQRNMVQSFEFPGGDDSAICHLSRKKKKNKELEIHYTLHVSETGREKQITGRIKEIEKRKKITNRGEWSYSKHFHRNNEGW